MYILSSQLEQIEVWCAGKIMVEPLEDSVYGEEEDAIRCLSDTINFRQG